MDGNYTVNDTKVIAFFPPVASGGAFYRSTMIQQALSLYYPDEFTVVEYGPDDNTPFLSLPIEQLKRIASTAHFYCATLDSQLGLARELRNAGVRIIHDMDDNYFEEGQNAVTLPRNAYRNIRETCEIADVITVSTKKLKEVVQGQFPDKNVEVVPNLILKPFLDAFYLARKGLVSQFQPRERKRVLWSGGLGHDRDFSLVEDIIKESGDSFDWILFGNFPPIQNPSVTVIPNKPFAEYWSTLLGLDVDLVINPLNPEAVINQYRSPVKAFEMAILAVPFLTNSDIYMCDDSEYDRSMIPSTLSVDTTLKTPEDWVVAMVNWLRKTHGEFCLPHWWRIHYYDFVDWHAAASIRTLFS